MGIEDPDADVAEQQRLASETDEDEAAEQEAARIPVPLEADPYDVAEQRADVPIEEGDELG
ncbi:MAG TPA: hypothetical protein VD813_15260 [Pseudonocardia sp.]|nr:hypothetical protein [Pseudonocardia sp.]